MADVPIGWLEARRDCQLALLLGPGRSRVGLRVPRGKRHCAPSRPDYRTGWMPHFSIMNRQKSGTASATGRINRSSLPVPDTCSMAMLPGSTAPNGANVPLASDRPDQR